MDMKDAIKALERVELLRKYGFLLGMMALVGLVYVLRFSFGPTIPVEQTAQRAATNQPQAKAKAIKYVAPKVLPNPLANKNSLARLQRSGMRTFKLGDKPRPVPQIALWDNKNEKQLPKNWLGRTILLNFWAPWCDPCRRELPSFDGLKKQLREQNFDVVAVNLDEDVKKANKMLDEMGIKRLIRLNDKKNEALKAFTAIGVPTTILIDCHGRELGRLSGATHWATDSAILLIKAMIRGSGCWQEEQVIK